MLGRGSQRRLPDMLRSSVVVHLDGDESIAGILLGDYADVVCLARARVLSEASGRAVPADGEILIPKGRIKWIQAGVKIDDTRDLHVAARQDAAG